MLEWCIYAFGARNHLGDNSGGSTGRASTNKPSPSFPSIDRFSPAFYLYGSFRNSPSCICVYCSYKCLCVCFAWSCIQSYQCMCVNACVPGSARPRSTNPSQSSHTYSYPSHPVKLHSHAHLSYFTTVLPYHKLSSWELNREREKQPISLYTEKSVCVSVCMCV